VSSENESKDEIHPNLPLQKEGEIPPLLKGTSLTHTIIFQPLTMALFEQVFAFFYLLPKLYYYYSFDVKLV